VVVSVTHRLGLLGFLDLRELGEAGSANAGLLDLVAALEWVQRNIAAFGGDPARVTICGQSGGGGKVAALNAMPAARDLFARSIMMSGPFGRSHPPEETAKLRERVMKAVGLESVDELRAASVETLLDAQSAAQREVASMTGSGARSLELDSALGFGPSLDPVDLPVNSFREEATEGVRGKQLLLGWTSHDASTLLVADPTFVADMSAAEAASRVDAFAEVDGVTYAELSAQYPHEPPHLLFGRRMTTLVYENPTRRIADLAAAKADGVWAYEFAQPTEVLDGLLGATHSMDISFAFGTVDRIPLTGRSLERHAVSRDMMRAWASFAHHGDPGWAPWDTTGGIHRFGTPIGPDSRLPEDVDMGAPLTIAVRQKSA
ncbi:carboxylesterase family protein, partial [Rhodococcus sp. C26F]